MNGNVGGPLGKKASFFFNIETQEHSMDVSIVDRHRARPQPEALANFRS